MTETLEPQLTGFDLRVLNALAAPSDDSKQLDFRSAWRVAELVGEYDVALVRDTLRGLVHFGYAMDRRWGARQEWMQAWELRDKAAPSDDTTTATASSKNRRPEGVHDGADSATASTREEPS